MGFGNFGSLDLQYVTILFDTMILYSVNVTIFWLIVNSVIWGICGNLFNPSKTLRTLRKTLRPLRLKKKKIA